MAMGKWFGAAHASSGALRSGAPAADAGAKARHCFPSWGTSPCPRLAEGMAPNTDHATGRGDTSPQSGWSRCADVRGS